MADQYVPSGAEVPNLLEDHFWMNRNAPEGPRHSHVFQGRSFTHSHPGGEKSHGYDDHPEDGPGRAEPKKPA